MYSGCVEAMKNGQIQSRKLYKSGFLEQNMYNSKDMTSLTTKNKKNRLIGFPQGCRLKSIQSEAGKGWPSLALRLETKSDS